MGFRAWLATLVAALALAAAAPAQAATAYYDTNDNQVFFQAAHGEHNHVTVSRDGTLLILSDSGAPVEAGEACAQESASSVSCPVANTYVGLRDGPDTGTTAGNVGTDVSVDFFGGRGSDVLTGTADLNLLNGGLGRDRLIGGAGTREIDAVNPGGGTEKRMPVLKPDPDEITCAAGSQPFKSLSVDRRDTYSGSCGQVFHYTPRAVVSRGTNGNDLLSNVYFPTHLYGYGGDDRMFNGGSTANRTDGGAGNDRIQAGGVSYGGRGDDRIDGSPANELPVEEHGGPGDDTLLGSAGPDRIFGGAGSDRIVGKLGDDRIHARDGHRDTISCGAGSDEVWADATDDVGADCERVQRG